MDPALLTIAEICFAEIGETPFHAIIQTLKNSDSEENRSSLKVLALKSLITAALENGEIKQKVKDAVSYEFLMLRDIHYLESQPDLLQIAIDNNCYIEYFVIGITIQDRTCRMKIHDRVLAKFPFAEDFERLRSLVDSLIRSGSQKFWISVKNEPQGTVEQMMDRILLELPVPIGLPNHPSGEACTMNCFGRTVSYSRNPLEQMAIFQKHCDRKKK